MKKNRLVIGLAGALLLPAVGATHAQSAPAADQAGSTNPTSTKELQTVVVTGSAIPRIDVETPSPVTVISATQIQRSGLTTLADVVRAVSADNSGSIPNAFSNGFAAGASGVALRGLTVNSTLVLIDGHRNASYAVADDGERSFVDLNTIPLAAVERIEVLKDGASSLYGADAIAGVVNVILKPDFHGVEATADVGTSQHGGGFTRKATFIAGGGDLQKDRYNAYFSAQYQKDNSIRIGQRGFPFNTADLSSIGGPNLQGGQPSQGVGSIYGTVTPGTLAAGGNPLTGVTPVAGAGSQVLAQGGCGPQGTLITNDPANPGSYCSQNLVSQYGQVQPATEQGGLYGRFTAQINDNTKAYLSASYFESKTDAPGGPRQIQSSTPNNTNNIALQPTLTVNGVPTTILNPNDPYAAQGQYALVNYAFGDIPSGFNYDNHNMRVVGDIAGVAGEWNYDAALVLNHTWLDTDQHGFINYDALIKAVNDGSYNFLNPGANTAAVRSALAPGYAKTSTSDMDSLDLAANRELWDLSGGALGLAVGAQFRHEAQNDPTLNPNFEFQGLGNALTKGSRDVSAAYVELDAPLLQSLEVDLSGRFDHYSDIGNGFTPKLGFKWKPLDWFALRGTYSRGIRAPSFSENGSSSTQGFVNYTPPADFIAAHGNSGYVQQYSLSEYTLANKNIKPERAKNFTLGIVVQPASWLNASVDYYNIKKTNVITTADTSAALGNYYAGLPQPEGVTVVADNPDPLHPDAQARPIEVIGEYINANSLKTSGVDVDLQAHFDFANGMHYVSELGGTEIFNWSMTFPGGVTQSYVGNHGPYNLSSGAGTPRYRESWSNTLAFGHAVVTGTFYHTSGMDNYAEDVGVGPGSCLTVLPLSCRVGSFTDFDLTGSYAITDHLDITASVMNAFDRKPPLDPADYAGAGANYNPTYAQSGLVGRFYNLGVKFKM